MISRIRLEAFGESAEAVASTLDGLAELLQQLHINGHTTPASPGECVIERDLREVPDGRNAWKGRMSLHPNIAEHE